jgi:hypothetical protein
MVKQWEMQFTDNKIYYQPPDSFIFHPNLPYFHPTDQQKALDLTLEALGWLEPVIVNLSSNYLLNGAMRVRRASQAQQKLVPVIYVWIPDEHEERAAILALNGIARKSLPDKDLPYIEKEDAIGKYREYTSELSVLDELVDSFSTASRKVKGLIKGLVDLKVIKVGAESRNRNASKYVSIEFLEEVKRQCKKAKKVVYKIADGSLRLYGDKDEVEKFLKQIEGTEIKRVG